LDEDLIEIYDRFSFDYLFRLLLVEGFDAEESITFILNNCRISTLVYQERIENEYYKQISISNKLSDDLRDLIKEIFNNYFRNKN